MDMGVLIAGRMLTMGHYRRILDDFGLADQVLAAIEADVVRSLRAHYIGTMVAMCRDHATNRP